jgi:hypothetical protein
MGLVLTVWVGNWGFTYGRDFPKTVFGYLASGFTYTRLHFYPGSPAFSVFQIHPRWDFTIIHRYYGLRFSSGPPLLVNTHRRFCPCANLPCLTLVQSM